MPRVKCVKQTVTEVTACIILVEKNFQYGDEPKFLFFFSTINQILFAARQFPVSRIVKGHHCGCLA